MSLPLSKNDITKILGPQKRVIYSSNQKLDNKKAGPLLTLLFHALKDPVHTSGKITFQVNGDMVESYLSEFLNNIFPQLGSSNLFDL